MFKIDIDGILYVFFSTCFFCSIELVKFICVGTCNCSLFIFPCEPFEVLNIDSRQGLYT